MYQRVSLTSFSQWRKVMSLLTTFKSALQAALATGLLLAVPLLGQEFRGTITGTVVDVSGAACRSP